MIRQRMTAWATAVTMATAALGLLTAGHARADVNQALELVAADAEVVVIVPSLAALNQQVSELGQTLNLQLDELDDVVGQLRHHAGMTAGVDETGPLVVALLDVSTALTDGARPTAALLVPVSDYEAFVGNFGGEAGEAIASLTMPEGQPAFAKLLGDHAVMSDDQAVVEAYAGGGDAQALRDTLGELGRKYLDESSAAVYIDLEAVGPAMMGAIDRKLAEFDAMIDEFSDADDPQFRTFADTWEMQRQYAAGTRSMIEGMQSMLLAIDLGERGLGVTKTFRMREGSALREYFPGRASQAAGELASLPDRPFLFAMAVDDEAIAFGRLIEAMLEAMPDEQQAMMGPLMQQTLGLIEQTQAYASALYVPDQMAVMSGGLLNAVNVYRVDDGDAYLAAWRDTLTGLDEQAVDLPEQAGAGDGQMTFTGRYDDNALQIDGVQVAQYRVEVELPDAMQQQQPDNPFAGMMNATAYGGYIAAKNDHVVMTTTTDPQIMRAALRALDQEAGIGAAGPIAEIREHALPPNAAVESYISLQGIAQMGNTFIAMFGGQPINVPDDVPPIAMGAGVQDDSVAFRLFLPAGAMRAVGDAGRQFAPMLGGPGDEPMQQPGRRPPY
ncbi:MAG: hypothetical protein WD534_03225 [Phycisphaeraceae bacterium]